MPITLTVEEQPNPEDAASVRDGLYAFNMPYAGDGDPRELNAFVRRDGRGGWRPAGRHRLALLARGDTLG